MNGAEVIGLFIRRREATRPVVADPIDSDRDDVIVRGSTRAPDPIREGDTPARPAKIQIAHSGIRGDWEADPSGLHVQIDRVSGRPRGRQAAFGDPYNVDRPAYAAWGSTAALESMNAEQIESASLLPLID